MIIPFPRQAFVALLGFPHSIPSCPALQPADLNAELKLRAQRGCRGVFKNNKLSRKGQKRKKAKGEIILQWVD